MKPNLVFVQPSRLTIDSEIEKFCESFCDSHYVYLVRPNAEFREDSSAGLRFLSNPLDQLPGFADVETTVSIADVQTADLLRDTYPDSQSTYWDPENESCLPDILVSLLRPTVVQGSFRPAEEMGFARAM